MNFASILKVLRGSRSFRDLEKESKINATTWWRLEQGKDLDLKTLQKIIQFYPHHKKDILLSLGLL